MNPTIESAAATRGEAREQAILDAALDLIGDVGYDRMSMDSLAARAQASKATIYRRWPGKAQVVVEAIRRRGCPDFSAPDDTGSLRGDLLVALRTKCDAMSGEDGPLFIGLLMAARKDPELASLLDAQMQNDGQPVLAELLDRAASRGEIVACADPAPICELVPALILQRLLFGDKPTDEAFIAHLIDDFVIPLLTGAARMVATQT
jgi:AcrR family transcriptional regulator